MYIKCLGHYLFTNIMMFMHPLVLLVSVIYPCLLCEAADNKWLCFTRAFKRNISHFWHNYPGYDGSLGEPDEQGYYMSGENLEIQYPVMLANNGSHMYFMPGFQPGYNPYTPYLPVGVVYYGVPKVLKCLGL